MRYLWYDWILFLCKTWMFIACINKWRTSMNDRHILNRNGNKPGRPCSTSRRCFGQVKQCTKDPQFQCISIAYCIACSLFYYRDLDCYLWNSDLHCFSLRSRHGWILFLFCLWHWAGLPVYHSRNLNINCIGTILDTKMPRQNAVYLLITSILTSCKFLTWKT